MGFYYDRMFEESMTAKTPGEQICKELTNQLKIIISTERAVPPTSKRISDCFQRRQRLAAGDWWPLKSSQSGRTTQEDSCFLKSV